MNRPAEQPNAHTGILKGRKQCPTCGAMSLIWLWFGDICLVCHHCSRCGLGATWPYGDANGHSVYGLCELPRATAQELSAAKERPT